MSERGQEFIQQAAQALNDGAFARAIELADQALAADPSSAEANMLKGIALAQSGQADAATQAFQTAISLESGNPKAHYNLAAHYYQLGQKGEALASARMALNLDPRHVGARDLIATIEQESGTYGTPGNREGPYTPYGQSAPRAGYGDQKAHSIAFVEKMGPTWTLIGWIIVLCLAINLAYSIWMVTAMLGPIFSGQVAPDVGVKDFQARVGVLYYVMSAFGLLVGGSCLVWGALDIADRRGNWLWMILFVCCNYIGLPVYLLTARKD